MEFLYDTPCTRFEREILSKSKFDLNKQLINMLAYNIIYKFYADILADGQLEQLFSCQKKKKSKPWLH